MTLKVYTPSINDAIYVANNLRPEDLSELQGQGLNAFNVINGFIISKTIFAFKNYQGRIAGIGGLIPDDNGCASIWLLCTPNINSMGITFYRRAKKFIEEIKKPYHMVYAQCDTRNTVHLRLLKHLGFKALKIVTHYKYNVPYFEVVKL